MQATTTPPAVSPLSASSRYHVSALPEARPAAARAALARTSPGRKAAASSIAFQSASCMRAAS
jgi:hypothetical protein